MKKILLLVALLSTLSPRIVNAGTCKLYLESWGATEKILESWDQDLPTCLRSWWNVPRETEMAVTYITHEDAYTASVRARAVSYKYTEKGKTHSLESEGTRELRKK